MPAIVTLTMNPSLDAAAHVARVIADAKLRISAPSFDPGGGGINVSRVVARLGIASVTVFPAGGRTGEELCDLLAHDRLDVRPIAIGGTTRSNLTVSETATDQQYRFVEPGPELAQHEREACLDAVRSVDAEWVVASGSLPPGVPDTFYADLARRLDHAGDRLIVDTAGAALRALGGGPGVFLIKPNVGELQELCGHELHDRDLERAAHELVDAGVARVVLLSLGAGGAYLASQDVGEHLRAPLVPIVSRVGAGDSMVAGVVTALAAGETLIDAARYGLAAGAAAVTTPGTELARREDVEQLSQRLGVDA
ncbi:MAG TPA: 1-phosphofructokinase family hexose kinase [Nitriliruptorales bacterium]|nr:1-phosphofructokinase family hexose kinase [Nitriliruptorales bacterium]